LEAMRLSVAPCAGPLPRGREHVWVRPELVCEVRYKEWTEDHLLRQPVFLRFRVDKAPEECRRDERRAREAPLSASGPSVLPAKTAEGATKNDLVEYHRQMAPWLLPYLRDRPLVLSGRAPGDSARAGLPVHRLWSDHAQREVECFVVSDVDSLL